MLLLSVLDISVVIGDINYHLLIVYHGPSCKKPLYASLISALPQLGEASTSMSPTLYVAEHRLGEVKQLAHGF